MSNLAVRARSARVPAPPTRPTRTQLRKRAAISLLQRVKRRLNEKQWTDGWGPHGDPRAAHCVLGWVAELAPDRERRTRSLESDDHHDELLVGYEKQPELRVALDALGRAVGDRQYAEAVRLWSGDAGKRKDFENDWSEAMNINDSEGLGATRELVDDALKILRDSLRR